MVISYNIRWLGKTSFICGDFVDDIHAVLWEDIWFHTRRPLLVDPTPSDRSLCGIKPDDCPLTHTVHFHSPGCLAQTPSETKNNEKEIRSKISTKVFGGSMMFKGTKSPRGKADLQELPAHKRDTSIQICQTGNDTLIQQPQMRPQSQTKSLQFTPTLSQILCL